MKYYTVKEQQEALRQSEYYLSERSRLIRQFANEKRTIQKLKNDGRFKMYILRYWVEYNQAYTYKPVCCWANALKEAREAKQAFNTVVEIYERKEAL